MIRGSFVYSRATGLMCEILLMIIAFVRIKFLRRSYFKPGRLFGFNTAIITLIPFKIRHTSDTICGPRAYDAIVIWS